MAGNCANRLIVCALFLVTVAAHAQNATPDARTTVGVLSDLNAANLIKEQQVKGAELDKKLRDAGQSTAASTSLTAGATSPNGATAPAPPPVVRAINGANGSLVATFLYLGGATRDGHKGDRLPGGYVVKELTADGVTLCKGGECFDTAMSGQAPVEQQKQQTANQPFVGMPMIPSGPVSN